MSQTALGARDTAAPGRKAGASSATPRRGPRGRRRAQHPWWFALPAIAVFAAFFLVPNLLNFFYPFTNWSAFHSSISFAGLANFRTILHDGSLQLALRTTLEYAVGVAIFQNAFGLILALLLEKDSRSTAASGRSSSCRCCCPRSRSATSSRRCSTRTARSTPCCPT